MKNEKNSKPKDKVCFIIGIVLLVAWLIGCVVFSTAERAEAAVGDYYADVMAMRDETKPYYALFYLYSTKGAEYLVFFESDTSAIIPLSYNVRYDNGGNEKPYLSPINGSGYKGFWKDEYKSVGNSWHFDSYLSITYIEGNMEWSEDIPLSSEGWPIVDARPLPTEYSPDAPYVSFDSIEVRNPIAYGNTKSTLFQNIYEDYITDSSWYYLGTLNNMDASKDLEYVLDVELLIELPTDEIVEQIAKDADINLEYSSKFLKNAPDMIELWNTYGDDIYDTRAEEYKVTISLPIEPNAVGAFKYGFTFPELEYLLHMDESFHSRWAPLIADDNEYWRAVLLSHMHISTVSMNVRTTRADAVVYGKGVINIFDRGIYDICVEIAPDVDFSTMTEEEVDKVVSDAVKQAEIDYRKELEERVERLEQELNNATGSLGVYDDLYEGQNLWETVKSAGAGIMSLLTSLTFIPKALGSIFTFFPKEMQDIMGYVVFLSIFFVIWRLFKGK